MNNSTSSNIFTLQASSWEELRDYNTFGQTNDYEYTEDFFNPDNNRNTPKLDFGLGLPNVFESKAFFDDLNNEGTPSTERNEHVLRFSDYQGNHKTWCSTKTGVTHNNTQIGIKSEDSSKIEVTS